MRPPDRVHVLYIIPMFAPRGVGVRLLYYGIFCIAKSLLQTHICFTHTRTRAHTRPHTEPSLPSPGVALACLGSRQSSSSARLSVGKTQR